MCYILTSRDLLFRFDRYQAECVVPWVNDVLLLLTVSLQTAQQLRDKLDIFKQYKQEIRLSIYPIMQDF